MPFLAEWALLNEGMFKWEKTGLVAVNGPHSKMFWVVAILSDKGVGLEFKVSWKILDILTWWYLALKSGASPFLGMGEEN